MDVVSPHVDDCFLLTALHKTQACKVKSQVAMEMGLCCCRALRAWLRMRGMTLSYCSREKMGWGSTWGVMGQAQGQAQGQDLVLRLTDPCQDSCSVLK